MSMTDYVITICVSDHKRDADKWNAVLVLRMENMVEKEHDVKVEYPTDRSVIVDVRVKLRSTENDSLRVKMCV